MIDLIDIDPKASWPADKRNNFGHLEALTTRIVLSGKDITSNMGADLVNIAMVYGMFGMEARDWYHQVCSLAKDYSFDVANDKLEWAAKDNKLKSLKKLITILRFYEIDTSYKDESLNDLESLSVYVKHDGVDLNFVMDHGFYPYINNGQTGYWFRTGEKTFAPQTNFVIEPLMHVVSKEDNKRIIAINNGKKRTIVDMPSKSVISLEQFNGFCYEEGNYMFWGGKTHLMKILNSINDQFAVCYELKTLGWQPQGFFAWSNAVFEPGSPGVVPFDKMGIAEIDNTKYFSPSASDIYSKTADDDPYENDRYLFHHTPKINFETWCKLMTQVYPDHAMYGIGFVFIGLFRDVIFKVDNNCPHMSGYGEKGSGKSKFAESISALFLNDLQPYNLNHGTEFSFFSRLSRFRNCITWFDEFDDQAIREDRFQSIKGAYDGSGRERGKGGNKNRTEIARINSALLLTGQYLSTRDDNAALTRCIIIAFSPNDNRTPDQIKAYEELKAYEKKGLSGILPELLRHRPHFEKNYVATFAETFAELRAEITAMGAVYKERVLRNYTALVTCCRMVEGLLTLPFTYKQLKDIMRRDIIRLSTLISESDSLADFWQTVVFLQETGDIYEGFHYRIIWTQKTTVKVDGKEKHCTWPQPVKLLAIRLTTIHKLYLEAHRKQTGKTGINMQSLELYMGSAKGYVGKNSSMQFTERNTKMVTNTSSYLFEYDLLGVSLEQSEPEVEREMITITGTIEGEVKNESVAGKSQLKFILKESSSFDVLSDPLAEVKKWTCYASILSNQALILSGQPIVVTGSAKVTDHTDRHGVKHYKRLIIIEDMRPQAEQNSLDFGNQDTENEY